jgi:HNH endonuclease
MIVEYQENKRTLRGEGANRKYRYTRRVLLKCEKCALEREVNCTRKIQQSKTHHCKSCVVKAIGIQNKGKLAWNKGDVQSVAECKVGSTFINSSGYCEVYVGNAFDKKQRKDKYRLLHKLVAQVKTGSYLRQQDLIHHVDGDKTNNNPNNLFICESKAIHQDIHT